jgi:hypothetical protein
MTLVMPDARRSRKPEARRALESPYRRDLDASEARRAERAVMPKTLDGLLEWFAEGMSFETPERIHRSGVWADHAKPTKVTSTGDIACATCRKRIVDVVTDEATEARPHTHPESADGSALGSPDDAGEWRVALYGSSSVSDDDGSYLRPMHRAIDELSRTGRPLMGRTLIALAAAGFDWHGIAERGGWAEEMFRDYLTAALMRLWHIFRDRDERRVTTA